MNDDKLIEKLWPRQKTDELAAKSEHYERGNAILFAEEVLSEATPIIRAEAIKEVVEDYRQLDRPTLSDKGEAELLIKIRMRWEANLKALEKELGGK